MHALRMHSDAFAELFDWAFHTHASHVLMHAALYAVLAPLLASLTGPGRGRTAMLLLVLVALLQESIQVVFGTQVFAGDEVFDMGVDLLGGGLGFALLATERRMRSEARPGG